ncbi:MAG: hypothetical protein PVH41_13815 [Anaerolineae bacterium]
MAQAKTGFTRLDSPASHSSLVGFYSAVITAAMAVVTFGLAMTAIPISGANCPGSCVDYPCLDTVSQYPRDFRWMVPAMVLVLSYVVLMVSLHAYTEAHKRIYSQIGLSFALVAAVILLADYYLQFSVVPVSLMNGETEGLPLLIQYNPHGVFLALDELGYLVMGLSFLFVGIALSGITRLELAIRWIFITGFTLVMLALAAMSIGYGLERLDRFEVIAISIDWLVLIVNGVLLRILFSRRNRESRRQRV